MKRGQLRLPSFFIHSVDFLNWGGLAIGQNVSFVGHQSSIDRLITSKDKPICYTEEGTIPPFDPKLDADTVDGKHADSFALANHTHTMSQIVSGVLSLTKGGTGVTSLNELKSLLGIGDSLRIYTADVRDPEVMVDSQTLKSKLTTIEFAVFGYYTQNNINTTFFLSKYSSFMVGDSTNGYFYQSSHPTKFATIEGNTIKLETNYGVGRLYPEFGFFVAFGT